MILYQTLFIIIVSSSTTGADLQVTLLNPSTKKSGFIRQDIDR